MTSPPPLSNTTSGSKTKPTPRPRANVQRRPQAEREAQALADEQRRQERAAELGNQASVYRTRGRGGYRGRGVASTQRNSGERVRPEDTGAVFGTAVSGTSASQRARASGVVAVGVDELISEGRPEGDRDGDAAKVDIATSTGPTGSKAKKSRPEPKAPEEIVEVDSDEGMDMIATEDIERIWISSDEDEKGGYEEDEKPIQSKGKQRAQRTKPTPGLRPVRAPRQPRPEEVEGRTTNRKIDGQEMDLDERFSTETPTSPELMRRLGRKGAKRKDSKSIPMETVEEREERLRYAADVKKMKEIFVPDAGDFQSKSATMSADSMETDETTGRLLEGKLYLFQFPPLTPFLVDESSSYEVVEYLEDRDQKPPEQPVKKEREREKGDRRNEIKVEENGDESSVSVRTKVPGALTMKSMGLPSGYVGKLKVHQSGKISLDWGGIDVEVRYGTQVDFLQDVVLLDGRKKDTSWAFGQVQEKMVVIPDWQKLYD